MCQKGQFLESNIEAKADLKKTFNQTITLATDVCNPMVFGDLRQF